jgi:uncharacterized protein
VNHEPELIAIVRQTPWLMRVLAAVRSLGLPEGAVGAGAVRTAVWNQLHGFTETPALRDVDVAYFDPRDISKARDDAQLARLQELEPDFPWEITNQAAIHQWLTDASGAPVPPFRSLAEAVASWPETATCVAVRLNTDDSIGVIAPLGLEDLFDMVVRRNPARVGVEAFRKRVAQKRFTERWPKVCVVSE